MHDLRNYSDYLGKRVEILETHKTNYHQVLHKTGIVERATAGSIGVAIDDMENLASCYGLFWFNEKEIKVLEEEIMEGYQNVAIVNLLEDANKKDYAFALYDEDFELFKGTDQMVVVNAKGKNNRVLGIVQTVIPAQEYDGKSAITAQVVGVVNMNAYIARVEEEERIKELNKKKAEIEKELEKEINKRKTMEFYEEMAKRYSDNPKLAELVKELKNLGA